jgi:hypothetical protein
MIGQGALLEPGELHTTRLRAHDHSVSRRRWELWVYERMDEVFRTLAL